MQTKRMPCVGRYLRTGGAGRSMMVPFCFTLAAMGTGAASAQELSIVAGDNPAVPSAFSLNFGEMGGVSTANIALTDIELAVDADAGTARFARYYQEVAPLALPGGISTGNLVIEVLEGSSNGVYDESTRTFATDEVYVIHFDGDLSAFGLESPVYLPGASAGEVSLATLEGGTIVMDWTGEGQLANPFDPQTPLEFGYTCTVNAAFTPAPATVVRLAMVPQVTDLALPAGIERGLTTKLYGATDALNAGDLTSGVNRLRAFNHQLSALTGRFVDEAASDQLLDISNAVVNSIADGGFGGSNASLGGGKHRGLGR